MGEKDIGKYSWQCLEIAMVLTLLFYLLQLAALIFRFWEFPNYVSFHDWYINVIRIFESTPSLKDSLLIAKDEWIVEVGYMNYDFGKGISEWSLFVAPFKAALVFVVNVVLAANFKLFSLIRRTSICSSERLTTATSLFGLGTIFFSLTSITMSWVVCCSTPTWVVGLAILGLGVSTSLWLEPLGLWLNTLGIGLLVASLIVQFRYLQKTGINYSKLNEGNLL